MTNTNKLLLWLAVVTLAVGCLPDKQTEAEYDEAKSGGKNSTADAGTPDADVSGDASSDKDTSKPDTSKPDATVKDTSKPDATVKDTSKTDTTVKDTNVKDTNVKDTNVKDTNAADTGHAPALRRSEQRHLGGGELQIRRPWKDCSKTHACTFQLGMTKPQCLPHKGKAETEPCNPFSAYPECGRTADGLGMRCHPVYRKCIAVCGNQVACPKGTVCDEVPPFAGYPQKAGHCMPSCTGACGKAAPGNPTKCFCDAACIESGDCCPDFKAKCAAIKPAQVCISWLGCNSTESCIPKKMLSGSWTNTCVPSGKAVKSCDPNQINSCAKSGSLGPQVCIKGACKSTCRPNEPISDCPPKLSCKALDATGKNFPGNFGVCL